MRKSVNVIEHICSQLDLRYGEKSNMGIGKYMGFAVFVYTIAMGNSSASYYGATILASKKMLPIDLSELFFEAMPATSHANVDGYKLNLTVGALGSIYDISTRIENTLNSAISALKVAGYCSDTPANAVDFNSIAQSNQMAFYKSGFNQLIKDKNAKENVIAGVLGSLLGALLGFVLMTIMVEVGYISMLGGIFLGMMTVIAYIKFARNYSMIGVVITSSIVAISAYLAFRTGTALKAYKDFAGYNISFAEFFKGIKQIYREADEMSTYYFNLITSIVTGIGGGLVMVYISTDLIKKK